MNASNELQPDAAEQHAKPYRLVSFHTMGMDTVFSTGFPSSVAGFIF
jgi:hypothetical protein